MSAAGRFARTADRLAALQDARFEQLSEMVRDFVAPEGDERALDVGTGAGALALALAPLVREVVGIDPVPELLALARRRAPANAEFVQGDGTRLPFANASFDLAGTVRTLHHVEQPEQVVAELARVTRPGGRMLVVDQLAPEDAARAAALHAFERARDPSHARLLSDSELRALFAAHGLEPVRVRIDDERRELAAYLDLAACEGDERALAEALARDAGAERASIGWYLLRREG